jgi:glycerophosphoryl diester phosphodiesterase
MKRIAYAGMVLAILAVTSGSVAASSTSAAIVAHPAVRAHRGGLHFDLVENTALNFRAAATEGRLAWEMDVRFTSSNVPVVLHDATLGLVGCPTKNIATTTMAVARACLAPNGQHVSTLYEVFSELKSTTATAWVELKSVPTDAQWTEFDSRLSAYKTRVVVESFLPAALAVARDHGYATALLSTQAVAPSALPSGTDWFSVTWTVITPAQVDAMHAAGVKVSVWTVDTLDRDSVPVGVDEVISNDVLYGK